MNFVKNVLIVGSGGREHTLAWKLNQSSRVGQIYVIPGNAGTAKIAKNVDIDILDFAKMADFAENNNIYMTFIGPEKPLVYGIVDYFKKRGLNVFGPNQAAAKLEGSKVYAKHIMEECGIPTARFSVFTEVKSANKYVENCNFPTVIKAEGLAAGKGVIIVNNKKEAKAAIKKIMENRYFGEAGRRVVIEEYLKGEEATIMVFADGQTYYPMVSAQDHKQVGEGDTGPNTGGMGAYAPTPLVTDEIKNKVDKNILNPLFDYLKKSNLDFKGVLFLGLMIKNGEPKVLEFNVRFGDPEAQVVLPLLENDLLQVAEKINQNKLKEVNLRWKSSKAMAVILASGGYPIEYEKGKTIKGLDEFNNSDNLFVIQAGTKVKENSIITDGGRVLALVALGDSHQSIYDRCYDNISKIYFADAYYRKDIGHRLKGVNLLKNE